MDTSDEPSLSALIALIKILKDSDTANVNSLLGLLRENTKVVIENNIPTASNSGNGQAIEMSADDVSKAKDLMNFMESFKNMREGEFSEEEK